MRTSQHPHQHQQANVIVIGAGMSGLAAAHRLVELMSNDSENANLDDDYPNVMVLEARDRLGGRIWTANDKDVNFGTIDLGAAWIHGHSKKNPITQLAKQVKTKKKCKLVPTNWNKMTAYRHDGSQVPQKELLKAFDRHDKIISRAQDALENDDHDSPLEEAIRRYNPQLLQDPLMNLVFAMEEEGNFGGSLKELSTWYFDNDSDFAGGDAMVASGYQDLCDHLAESVKVCTGVKVNCITYHGASEGAQHKRGRVQIETSHGTFSAGHCIVTVPLGVLKANAISFEPKLPPSKQTAIQQVGFGCVAKVALAFHEVFWPKSSTAFGNVVDVDKDSRGKFHYIFNMVPVTGRPVLVAFCNGDYVKQMESLSASEIVGELMDVIRTMFGNDCPDPIDSYITEWGKDPFSRGTYSFHAVGQKNRAWHDLADSVEGVLHFAGEHCSKEYRGTVHGAYLSGKSVAEKVLKHITKG